MWRPKLMSIPSAEQALPGRSQPAYVVNDGHYVHGRPFLGECPQGLAQLMVGMGCFWGAERRFWMIEGVYSTSVGYGAGHTPNPTYEEVCSGLTGHNELVRIWYNPAEVTLETLLQVFWQSHDPTQGMRQGNDIGTQYRSGIYLADAAERQIAEQTRDHYQHQLSKAGLADITTEILPACVYYPAETYHQQYLAKNPNGYCGLGGCSVPYL
ncbi:peptide-methionine (S)-S-oxide reductase MsrA [Thalassolituus marinus]|uniref:Peptide methionine sulfoxide reductase MsrA n=2 Tax=Thalassolituus marinus TaxID=671053 RepID=A0ABS7ZVB9_9GAMM|nr:peptide-methionine (S)-S-oxide reductase MsrA [Thalassolituus marinus]